MKYMLLIYADWSQAPADGEMDAYFKYSEELAGSGQLVGGDPLQGPETATTVAVRDGKTTTTDGPFAETKEVLGGYYIVDCDDLDQALAWGAKIPSATFGRVEVRPLMEVPGM